MTTTLLHKRLAAVSSKHSLKFFFTKIMLIALFVFNNAYSQSFEGLQKLDGFNTQTFYSHGSEVKAKRMAKQLDKVMQFYQSHLEFTPTVTLLILSPQDWPKHTQFPFYGMPHYTNQQTLVVASEDNPFWKNTIPNINHVTKEVAQLFTETYSNKNGNLSLESFFDLLTIHELGHAYQSQGQLSFQRKWMGELFCNMLLHTYIAENEPELLNNLTVFPQTLVATTDKTTLKYSSLNDLENYYDELGKLYPQNYAWYQCRWHIAAAEIYDNGKILAIKNWFTQMRTSKNVMDDTTLAIFLNNKVHKSVAEVMLHWDH